MRRVSVEPRHNWQGIVESQGMHYHTLDGQPYWDESAYYEFTAAEIDTIEQATYTLNELCLAAVQYVVDHHEEWFPRFAVPEPFWEWVLRSWDRDEFTIYGRFDLSFTADGTPKLLEFNADTPTALLEAAVIQWHWLEQRRKMSADPLDQFNTLHERLIEGWRAYQPQVRGTLFFTGVDNQLEDYMTVQYLRDTAIQAGLETEYVPVEQIRWDASRGSFVQGVGEPGKWGYREVPIRSIFKLYPWEWMVREKFGPCLLQADTRWLEAPWKMLLSNKAILPVLYELQPDCPYLLRAEFQPWSSTYVEKPILAREGACVRIIRDGDTLEATDGMPFYEEVPKVYQELCPLPSFGGNHPVVGSWLVNGWACGIGIREDRTLITGNGSRFIPHAYLNQG